jgi:hypothetical protein
VARNPLGVMVLGGGSGLLGGGVAVGAPVYAASVDELGDAADDAGVDAPELPDHADPDDASPEA